MKRGIALVALVLLGLGGTARATTITGTTQYPLQEWIDASAVPTPGGSLEVREQRCPTNPQALGCAFIPQRRVYIFDSGSWGTDGMRHGFLHEVGHVWDSMYLDASERAAYMKLRGYSGSWWGTSYANAGEKFATDYSDCAWKNPNVTFSAYPYDACVFIWASTIEPELPAKPPKKHRCRKRHRRNCHRH